MGQSAAEFNLGMSRLISSESEVNQVKRTWIWAWLDRPMPSYLIYCVIFVQFPFNLEGILYMNIQSVGKIIHI